jgi:hypothetical protein
MWSHRTGDTMHVEIAVESMPNEEIHLVEGNLRQIIGVNQVIQVRPEMRRPETLWAKMKTAPHFDGTPGERTDAMAASA